MIKHIVMFKLKEFDNEEEKFDAAKKVKAELDKLPALIPEIKKFETGINIVDSERAFDVVLVSEFETIEELDVYRIHPAHLAFIEFNNDYREKTVSVDYEI